ncbi:hypothetical protein [Nonomuraea sp. NPDC049750]|uniref:hypothetical protein n=1 Tax=Nonomuraea sp. NPDC049750 TaxID=3154738 RepID=UPI0033F233C1
MNIWGADEDGFFVWAATDGHGRGSGGVTGTGLKAASQLYDAISALEGDAVGSMNVVHLDRYARQPSYIYGPVVLRIRRDKATGEISLSPSGN